MTNEAGETPAVRKRTAAREATRSLSPPISSSRTEPRSASMRMNQISSAAAILMATGRAI